MAAAAAECESYSEACVLLQSLVWTKVSQMPDASSNSRINRIFSTFKTKRKLCELTSNFVLVSFSFCRQFYL